MIDDDDDDDDDDDEEEVTNIKHPDEDEESPHTHDTSDPGEIEDSHAHELRSCEREEGRDMRIFLTSSTGIAKMRRVPVAT